MYQAENGERITPEMKLAWDFKPTLMKYLKTVKDCGYGSNDNSSCIPNYGTDNENNSTNYTTYTGKKLDLQFFDDGQFILADGSLVLLESISSERLYISVDVNGYKKNRIVSDRIYLCFRLIKKEISVRWEQREQIFMIKKIHIVQVHPIIPGMVWDVHTKL